MVEIPLERVRASHADAVGHLTLTDTRLTFEGDAGGGNVLRMSIPLPEIEAAILRKRRLRLPKGRVLELRLVGAGSGEAPIQFSVRLQDPAAVHAILDFIGESIAARIASESVGADDVHVDIALDAAASDYLLSKSATVYVWTTPTFVPGPVVNIATEPPADVNWLRYADVEPCQVCIDHALAWYERLEISYRRRWPGKLSAKIASVPVDDVLTDDVQTDDEA